MSVPTRLVSLDDAPVLAELHRTHRAFLAPWEPARPEEYFTVQGQRAVIEGVLEQHVQGHTLPHLILNDERVVGRITLSEIVRGAFLSCRLGYWVAPTDNGRGVATAAVGLMARVAFRELGLHRIEANTLLHNEASQKVLLRNGFTRFGMSPGYLKIAGQWQDHAMHQLLSTDLPGSQ